MISKLVGVYGSKELFIAEYRLGGVMVGPQGDGVWWVAGWWVGTCVSF